MIGLTPPFSCPASPPPLLNQYRQQTPEFIAYYLPECRLILCWSKGQQRLALILRDKAPQDYACEGEQATIRITPLPMTIQQLKTPMGQ